MEEGPLGSKINYREEALEQRSVQERYDSAIQIVSPRGWLLLLTIGALVTALIAWSFLGAISYTVTSSGLLIREGEVFDVLATQAGQILEVRVKVGDVLQPGQEVALVDQPDIDKTLQMLKEELVDLERKAVELTQIDQKNFELKKKYYREKARGVGRTVRDKRDQLRLLEDKKKTQEELLSKGLIAKTTLIATTQQLLSLKEELNFSLSELKDISAQESSLLRGVEEQRWFLNQQISEKRREIEKTKSRLEVGSKIICKKAGRVIELKLNAGDYIHTGSSLLTLESLEHEPDSLEVIAYIPVTNGKRVKQGMEMQLVPSFARAEEDGFVLGQVTEISTYPISLQSMIKVTRNASLAESLLATGPVYEVRGRLALDPTTISGFRWSTKKGARYPIHSGTFCTVLITVKKIRPYELVIPAIRSALGEKLPDTQNR